MFARPQLKNKSNNSSFFQYGIAGKGDAAGLVNGLKIPESLLCEFCEDKLENPVRLDCDHVFCESCALILFNKDEALFREKMKNLKQRKVIQSEGIDSNLKVKKDRDLAGNLVGKSLKLDEDEKDEVDIQKKLEFVKKGQCVNCNFKLNGIFNKVDRLMTFLEKAKESQSKQNLAKRSKSKESRVMIRF